MSDTYRRHRAIKQAILQFYQPRPTGHREKHFTSLVALICGLVGGRHAHLPTIADHAPSYGSAQASVIKRFTRWLNHEQQTHELWFLPVAQQLLQRLADKPLQLIMDGSTVGRGCMALMVSVVYGGRALPLCWLVVPSKKGHLSEELHRKLLEQVYALVPAGAEVTFMGDGEFDGIGLQGEIEGWGWQYVCRTACNICLLAFGIELTVGALAPKRGELLALTPAMMTAQRYGPVSILALWEERCEEPLYLVTNMSDLDAAFALYQKRPHIETFFSDQKSRGFNIDKSHLSEAARLSRLLLASCLAYLWLVYLGVCALRDNWLAQIHRKDRCDLSLFRLGLRLVARCLKEDLPIPSGFLVPAVPPAAFVPS